MKVIFSARAEADLREILAHLDRHYPSAQIGFETRLRDILNQVGEWPRSAQTLPSRPGVRMVPMMRYPYHLFYALADETIEVLHIRHGARDDLEHD